MAVIVEAVYENGVLRPAEPLPWKEGERVRVEVSSLDSPLLKAYGIMGFKGTAEEAEYFALDSCACGPGVQLIFSAFRPCIAAQVLVATTATPACTPASGNASFTSTTCFTPGTMSALPGSKD